MACLLCQQTAGAGEGSRNCSVSWEAHAKSLGKAVHGICGKQACTGAAARAGYSLNLSHTSLSQLACCKFASSLKGLADGNILAIQSSWKHWAARYNYAWDIKSCGSHQHAWNNLIAVRNKYKAIKAGSHGNRLNRICNKLSGGQRELHTGVTHSNTIAYANSREFQRSTASSCNTKLCSFSNLAEMNMSRNYLIERIYNTDERLFQILRTKAHCIKQ